MAQKETHVETKQKRKIEPKLDGLLSGLCLSNRKIIKNDINRGAHSLEAQIG